MKLGYVIAYVDDVPSALAFYYQAFGLQTRFIDPTNSYGELETGGTALAFAQHATAQSNLPSGYRPLSEQGPPPGMEIGLLTDDVPAALLRAVTAGATTLAEPKVKPWGQTVAYVRCPFGLLVEICTSVG